MSGRTFHKTRSQSCFALEGVLVAGGQLDGFIDLSAKKRHKVCDVAAAKIIIEESGAIVFDGTSGRALTDDALTQDLNRKINVVAAATKELGNALCDLI
jgi:fructose-1,6-bisphosphatase/inositol monophosphatase family enzyme